MEFTLIQVVALTSKDRYQFIMKENTNSAPQYEISMGICVYFAWLVLAMFAAGSISYALFAKKLKGHRAPTRIAEANRDINLR